MANYDNLPVYKAAYDLLIYVFKVGHNMERDYRYTLGEAVKKDISEVLILIYRANSATEKSEFITEAREGIVVVKLHLRLLCDLKQISVKAYAHASLLAESVSKQLAAWQKAQQKNKEDKHAVCESSG